MPIPRHGNVENAKFVRYAESNGNYADVLGMLSAVKAPQS